MRSRGPVVAALLAQAWACSSMQPVPVEFIPQTNPTIVELQGRYGLSVAVAYPRLSGDTVYGTTPSGKKEVAVPLHEIERINARRFSRARTALFIGGGVALAGLATYFILVSGNSAPELDCGIQNPIDPDDREKCGI